MQFGTKVSFSGVDVNVVDGITVRIASINGIPAENTVSRLGIRVLPEDEFNNIQSIRDNGLRTDNLRLYDIRFANQNSNYISAYRGGASAAIPYGVTLIDRNSGFQNKGLVSVTLPSSLTRIGESAFSSNSLTSVVIPDSVAFIGNHAFSQDSMTRVTIGANVQTDGYYFLSQGWLSSGSFNNIYTGNNRRAGTYTWDGRTWAFIGGR